MKRRDCCPHKSPSPQGGEGWGEGVRRSRRIAARGPLSVVLTVPRNSQMLDNRFHNAVDIFHDVVVPKADDSVAMGLDHAGPQLIGLAGYRMLPAVQFDDEFCVSTGEVSDCVSNWELAHEFMVRDLSIAQARPKKRLCISGITSQMARFAVSRFSVIADPPHPTLSPTGEGLIRALRQLLLAQLSYRFS